MVPNILVVLIDFLEPDLMLGTNFDSKNPSHAFNILSTPINILIIITIKKFIYLIENFILEVGKKAFLRKYRGLLKKTINY